MAEYGAPGTEFETPQPNQTAANIPQQNNTQVQGAFQQNRGGQQGPRPGDKIFRSKDEDDDTKLFIGGLNWQTDKDVLEDYFQKFGDIDDIVVKKDDYGKSRCFAFIKFKEGTAAKEVLSRTHVIDHKQVDCKIARKQPKPDFLKVKKLFVGGLSNSTTETALRKYFTTFGPISHFDQPVDQETQKKRGFCFITFETEDAVNEAMKSQYHYIGEEQARVEVKRAQNKGDKQEGGPGGYGHQQGQRQGGQTGYWGDWSQGGYNQGGYDQSAYQQYPGYGQYPQYAQQYANQYPGYNYGGQQPYYDQAAYNNYYQGYNYSQQGGYDYSQQAAYPQQGYQQTGTDNSQYGKAQTDTSSAAGATQQYHPYTRT